jgi:NAD(P)-dependent dehydrogenase (short-subunit alcohol dehydrogenase family)
MPLLIVVGYGPGISHATAERFGREGYAIALIGRTRDRIEDGASRLQQLGIDAHAYVSDASDLTRITATIAEVREAHGPIGAVLWTATRNGNVSDVLSTPPDQVGRVFANGVEGLLAVVQTALDDLRTVPGAAVLVANGGLGDQSAAAEQMAATYEIDGTALEAAAKSKLVGILAERLRADGIYVGEIIIASAVRTPASPPGTGIDPHAIAHRFWTMATERDTVRTRFD